MGRTSRVTGTRSTPRRVPFTLPLAIIDLAKPAAAAAEVDATGVSDHNQQSNASGQTVAQSDHHGGSIRRSGRNGAEEGAGRTGTAPTRPVNGERDSTVTTALAGAATAATADEADDVSARREVMGAVARFTQDLLPGRLDAWLAANHADLVALRRRIHAHPELSGQERATASLVASKLRAVGLKPRMLSKRNGLICDIGTGDRVVALRADLDALPLPDIKDVPYRSKVDNVCHACGHDVHTTILVGVGRLLAELNREGQLPGRSA